MFTGHSDWQHPDVCKMLPVLMMHSERRPRDRVEGWTDVR